MEEDKDLTWDDLANDYDKVHAGRKARTMRMETIFAWAKAQTDKYFVNAEGYIRRVEKEVE